MSILMDPALSYTARVIQLARSQVGVREDAGRPNRGRTVDEYIRAAGLDPNRGSYPWCVCFVQWCMRGAAHDMGIVSPLPRTASVSNLWNKTPALHSDMPVVGAVFCMDKGGGKGHAGIVVDIVEGRLVTIEGNTNAAGHRDGNQVAERSRRRQEITYGFIDVSRTLDAAHPTT